MTIKIARACFDEVIQFSPSTYSRLAEDAEIVSQPQFESEIVKM